MLHTERVANSDLPNGPAAAAILAAAFGCFAMGLFYVVSGASAVCNRLLSMYQPAGALSGVSVACCIVWLAVWALLHSRWQRRNVAMRPISILSLLLLAGALLLTFPPVARLF